jgi:hypothetical protein
VHSKRFLLVTAVFLCLVFGYSRLARASLPVDWDLRMGPSVTGVTGELADSLDRTGGGFDGGLAIRWPRPVRQFGIQGELLFASRSRTFEDIVGFRRSLQVVYAQVPMLARASLHRSGKLQPYALAGPYFAWRLSSHIEPGQYVGDEPVNPADVRANDFGAIFGLGTDVAVGRGRATLELRFGLGLTDVLEESSGIGGAYRVLTLLLAFTPR